jgi:hypothetical protein
MSDNFKQIKETYNTIKVLLPIEREIDESILETENLVKYFLLNDLNNKPTETR